MKLDRSQQLDLAAGRAKILTCAACGKPCYYGAMNLIALGISRHNPACSYACNKKLGQVLPKKGT